MKGRLWMLAMKDGISPDDFADAAFKGQAFSFGGTDTIRGATASATIAVRKIELQGDEPGYAVFSIGIYKDDSLVASDRKFLTASGTYSVTTTSVDLLPGAHYHVEAGLTILPRGSNGSRVIVSDAEVTEIRWSF